MLRLRTLGGAAVENDRGVVGGTGAQRKSLAVLALLASAGDGGVSRDRIMALLWPETVPERAAHRLAQLLYALRRGLAANDLFVGAAELRLNPARMTSDLAEFLAARHAGALESAVSCYGGPFLDGFFLSDAPEFERWVEVERAALGRTFTELVEALAAEASARGDQRHAAEWWGRLAQQDPLSSRVTAHLMSALAAAGNRAGALERARVYETLVRSELSAEPNPAVVELAEELRQRPGGAAFPSLEVAAPDILVAVLPFMALGADAGLEAMAAGLVEELAGALGRLERVRVAARLSAAAFGGGHHDAREIGRRLGVNALVDGTVRQAGGRVRVSVQLVHAGDGCHLWAERYECPTGDAFVIQDELSGLITAAVAPILQGLRKPRPAAAT